MKGQISLEMIIGLLILLVVAFVVIRLFLNQTSQLGSLNDVQKSLAYQEFKDGCNQLCTEGNIAQWCQTKLTGDTDLNRNNIVDAIPSEGLLGIKVCEDGMYCMNMFPCATSSGKLLPSDCVKTLCAAYYQTYQNMNIANSKVHELFPSAGSCQLKSDPSGGTENWYTLYGFGPNPPCSS